MLQSTIPFLCREKEKIILWNLAEQLCGNPNGEMKVTKDLKKIPMVWWMQQETTGNTRSRWTSLKKPIIFLLANFFGKEQYTSALPIQFLCVDKIYKKIGLP